jgi:putative ribosome biogenesis GTPase RsgA
MGEKGCAVINAIIKGIITGEKLKIYRKLQKNLNILKKNRIKMLI